MTLESTVEALRNAGWSVRIKSEPNSIGWQPPGTGWAMTDTRGITRVGTYHHDAFMFPGAGQARIEAMRCALEKAGFALGEHRASGTIEVHAAPETVPVTPNRHLVLTEDGHPLAYVDINDAIAQRLREGWPVRFPYTPSLYDTSFYDLNHEDSTLDLRTIDSRAATYRFGADSRRLVLVTDDADLIHKDAKNLNSRFSTISVIASR